MSDSTINPFLSADLQALTRLLGGLLPSLDCPRVEGTAGFAFPLSATLDTEGTPQSGTGQAALLTGQNAAAMYGRHFGPWTPVRLRPMVEQESLLARCSRAGGRVAFANAYPKGWPGPRGGRRIAGPPLAARGAGVLDRHEEELGRGEAISSEIVNEGWKEHLGFAWLPDVTPEEAGANLARIAGRHDLTVYAHYTTDTAGHRGRMPGAIEALERVDGFLAGLVEHLSRDTLLLIASDHGNIEDVRGGHTRNPALGVATGAEAERAADLKDIRDVTPFILDLLGVGHPATVARGSDRSAL